MEKQDSSNSKVVMHLEDQYPKHDRRLQGYKLTGFVDGAYPVNKSAYPYGMVPIWRYLGWDLNKKYDGSTLIKLRKKNGIGKPKSNTKND